MPPVDWLLLALLVVLLGIVMRLVQARCFVGMDIAVAKAMLEKLPEGTRGDTGDSDCYARGFTAAEKGEPPSDARSPSYLNGFLDSYRLRGKV